MPAFRAVNMTQTISFGRKYSFPWHIRGKIFVVPLRSKSKVGYFIVCAYSAHGENYEGILWG